jgi:DNA polymerase
VLLGEAWGESEAMAGKPFVGQSGQELWRMLGEAMPEVLPEEHLRACQAMRYGAAWIKDRELWLEAAGIAMTSVFNLRPEGNKIESLCETKRENKAARPELQLARGQYLKEEFLPELARLKAELTQARPNLIVALGNTACWATLRTTGIGGVRGTAAIGVGEAPGIKILPTYHPSGVLRTWSWRPIVVADLMKAKREGEFAELRRPARRVLINPTLGEIGRWIGSALCNPDCPMAIDIETGNNQIKCVGFAVSPQDALVIPFVDLGAEGGNYWPTASEEREAWLRVQQLLGGPWPKVFQNGVYDLQYLLRLGLRPENCLHDTMLLHHSLYPELQKGLGFLGSVYTNEASWKLMRRQKAAEQMTKADE